MLFTPGDKDIAFSCWMGMIRGVIKVVDDVGAIDTSKADSSIPAPSSGMPCCTGQSAAAAPSIYGSDLSKVPTERLIQRSKLSGNKQTVTFNGIGYEFEPLIAVVTRSLSTSMVFNLEKFDNPTGTFDIIDLNSGDTLRSFEGKNGIISLDYEFAKSGKYGILKDKVIVGAIVVEENTANADLEKIREELLGR
jgi:plastocyanin domain-containing protein